MLRTIDRAREASRAHGAPPMEPVEEQPALRWPDALDHAALFAGVCAPRRAALDRARAALEGVLVPREALEIAAANGLCPVEWLTSDDRAFGGAPHSPRRAPYAVDAVLAMVSDVPGVLRAEALAREFVARASCFTREVPSSMSAIYWKPLTPSRLERGARLDGRWHIPWALMRATFRSMNASAIARAVATIPAGAERASAPRRGVFARLLARLGLGADPALFADGPYAHPVFARWNALAQQARTILARQALEDHRLAWEYALAARAGLTLRSAIDARWADELDSATLDRPLASVPNPFAPLAELWRSGYAIYATERAKMTLVLPLIRASAERSR